MAFALTPRHKQWLIDALAIALGLFFIYAGGKKVFFSNAPRPAGGVPAPQEFIDLIKALRATGFYLTLVGWLQLLAGIALLPRLSRLLGALLLAPITFNIFIFHLVLDNRWNEYLFTGSLLLVNMLIILAYFPQLLVRKKLSETGKLSTL